MIICESASEFASARAITPKGSFTATFTATVIATGTYLDVTAASATFLYNKQLPADIQFTIAYDLHTLIVSQSRHSLNSLYYPIPYSLRFITIRDIPQVHDDDITSTK